jgi:hypothetical protein
VIENVISVAAVNEILTVPIPEVVARPLTIQAVVAVAAIEVVSLRTSVDVVAVGVHAIVSVELVAVSLAVDPIAPK